MLSGIKNFAINRVLRKIADSARLNVWTNWIAAAIAAAIAANANWVLLLQYRTPAGIHELLRVAGVMAAAVLMYLTGKFPGLKAWLPVVEDVIQEAEKESAQSPAASPGAPALQ